MHFGKTFALQTLYQKKAGVMILLFGKETGNESIYSSGS